MNTEEKVKDKIRKLLRVAANDAATEGEIHNAVRAARALMLAHSIDEGEVTDEERGRYGERTCRVGPRCAYWEKGLATFVKDLTGCFASLGGKDRKGSLGKSSIHFWGLPDDVEAAADTYDALRGVIWTLGVSQFGNVTRGDGRTYAEGFVRGLHSQIKTADQDAIASQGRELVVQARQMMRRRTNAIEHHLRDEKGMRFGAGRSRSAGRTSSDAWAQGRADGAAADTSNARTQRLAIE